VVNYLVVFLGGGLGSLCRFYLSTLVNRHMDSFFPYGTLTVNLLGSFVIGLCFELFDRVAVPVEARILLTAGFLGGFTTFSTFAYENSVFLRLGQYRHLFTNFLVQNIAGLLFVLLGILAVRLTFKFILR